MRVVAFSTDRRILTDEAPLQRAYASRLDSYTVYVGSRSLSDHRSRSLGERAQAIGFSWRLFFRGAFWRNVHRADVISAQDPFETGLFAMFCAFVFRKPLYVQIHTDPFSEYFAKKHRFNGVRQLMAHVVLRHATRIRTVSEKVKQELAARGYAQPITVLPIFVDIQKFRAASRAPHKKQSPHLLMVGRLEKEKQFEEGIRALALIRAHGYGATLTVVGEGSAFAFLATEAQQHGVVSAVDFVGWQDDLISFFEKASVLLVPSAYEGYGLVIIEALAAGVPVVAHDVGVAQEAGAIIAPEGSFADTVLAWVEHGARSATLKNYPYESREAYLDAWVRDIHDTRV